MLVFSNVPSAEIGQDKIACYGKEQGLEQARESDDGREDSSLSFASTPLFFGSSPKTPLDDPTLISSLCEKSAAALGKGFLQQAKEQPSKDMLSVSIQTLVGCSELLGHSLESRDTIQGQQDTHLVRALQHVSTTTLRDASQRPLFIIAPLDVLVTREHGINRFHIIEINGTGIAGITNMTDDVINTMMTSISEVPKQLQHIPNPVVLVASSGQETFPPVSRTMHEKMLYIEALKKGFTALGRPCQVTNMSKLEQQPGSMPASGVTLVLGYMKQFRKHFSLDPEGRLVLMGRQVQAAINDRFVLNIMHQFNHKVNLHEFMGYNACFQAGADKGIAYELYNNYFSGQAKGQYTCMAPEIHFQRAFSRDSLMECVQNWLEVKKQPVVIKPQGTGCGHGIEFFFGDESRQELESKVDAAIGTVASSYNLECGGLPYTVCEFLDTATVCPEGAKKHKMVGHKFEMRIVVYRDGDELKAFPSIAKVARNAFDPEDPSHDKGALINNITTSSKETAQAGSEFMLALSSSETLELLGVSVPELTELCGACTGFIRFVLDQVQDNAALFGLPEGALPKRAMAC